MTVDQREDKLDELKSTYSDNLQQLIAFMEKKRVNASAAQKHLTATHNAGVEFFNAFERTLDEYSLPEIDLSKDVINRKVEDCINIVDTVLAHWNTLRTVSEKFELICPKPSLTAYASIQRVIKRFKPELVESIKGKFAQDDLPVYGFEDRAKHTGFKKPKPAIVWQVVIGLCFIALCVVLGFVFNTPTPMEYMILRALLAVGVTLVVSVFVQGVLDLKWNMTSSLAIHATGIIAFYILFYYVNPPGLPRP